MTMRYRLKRYNPAVSGMTTYWMTHGGWSSDVTKARSYMEADFARRDVENMSRLVRADVSVEPYTLTNMARLRDRLRPFLADGVTIDETNLGAGEDLVLKKGDTVLCLSAIGDDMTYLSVSVDHEELT